MKKLIQNIKSLFQKPKEKTIHNSCCGTPIRIPFPNYCDSNFYHVKTAYPIGLNSEQIKMFEKLIKLKIEEDLISHLRQKDFKEMTKEELLIELNHNEEIENYEACVEIREILKSK